MPVRRCLVTGGAALAALLIGMVISGGGAVLLAIVVGLAVWWLTGRYFTEAS